MSKFDLPGVGSNWQRIGRAPYPEIEEINSTPVSKQDGQPPGYAPEDISTKYCIPSYFVSKFSPKRSLIRWIRFVPLILISIVTVIFLVWDEKAAGYGVIWSAYFVFIFAAISYEGHRRLRGGREAILLRGSKSPGDTREICALFYGTPEGIFSRDRQFADVGFVDNQGGLAFEGNRHSFSLSADQITKAQLRPFDHGDEIMEIEWRTPEGNLSTVFLVDAGVNEDPAHPKPWLDSTRIGSRKPGPMPIDCSQFPENRVGNLLVIPIMLGSGALCAVLAALFAKSIRPSIHPAHFPLTWMIWSLIGTYAAGQIYLMWVQRLGSKIADEKLGTPTE
ncbi:MAG TPA: hypothetical protein VK171_12370 [Fimbriimonas sp.]|nr:hypothetical protein [Fimbriimonas sp.]